MKIRHGFVSNSSSSSFVLYKPKMTKKQINSVKNHMEYWNEIEDSEAKFLIYTRWLKNDDMDAWEVTENDHNLTVETSMDNFNMEELFRHIGLRMDAIISKEYG